MSIFLHAILRWASVVCLVVYGAGDALAATITLETNFPGRGWFNDIGFHVATNDNTFTGTVNPNPEAGSGRGLNSFFHLGPGAADGQYGDIGNLPCGPG